MTRWLWLAVLLITVVLFFQTMTLCNVIHIQEQEGNIFCLQHEFNEKVIQALRRR